MKEQDHIIELIFSTRDEAERIYEWLENSKRIMQSGGTLTLRSIPLVDAPTKARD